MKDFKAVNEFFCRQEISLKSSKFHWSLLFISALEATFFRTRQPNLSRQKEFVHRLKSLYYRFIF